MKEKIYWVKYKETRILEQRVIVREGEDPEKVGAEAILNTWNSRRYLGPIGPDFDREVVSVEEAPEIEQKRYHGD